MRPRPGIVPRYLDRAIVRQAERVVRSAEQHRLLVEAYGALLAQRDRILAVGTEQGEKA